MTDNYEIEQKLWTIFDELSLAEKTENGVLLLQDQIDSMQLISIIVDIEEQFCIEIPDEYMVPEFVSSFEHICDIVGELVGQVSENEKHNDGGEELQMGEVQVTA